MTMESGSEAYELDAYPSALRQLRVLIDKAKKLGLTQRMIDTLQAMKKNLRTAPAQWGDPDYHPKKKGSCVYHRACDPLFVKYVVFEPERKVIVLEIKPFPGSALE